jgi:hypothetical protein
LCKTVHFIERNHLCKISSWSGKGFPSGG